MTLLRRFKALLKRVPFWGSSKKHDWRSKLVELEKTLVHPESVSESFLPYREIYLNGEDWEMWARDMMHGDSPV